MSVKNVITLGIGADPGGLMWLLTGGLGLGAGVVADVAGGIVSISDASLYSTGLADASLYAMSLDDASLYSCEVSDG